MSQATDFEAEQQQRIDALTQQLAAARGEIERLRGEWDASTKREAKTFADLCQLRTELAAANERAEAAERECEHQTKRADDWRGSYELVAHTDKAELQRLVDHHKDMRTAAEKHETQIVNLCGQQLATAQARIAELEQTQATTAELFRREHPELYESAEVADWREAAQDAEQTVATLREQVERLEREREEEFQAVLSACISGPPDDNKYRSVAALQAGLLHKHHDGLEQAIRDALKATYYLAFCFGGEGVPEGVQGYLSKRIYLPLQAAVGDDADALTALKPDAEQG